MKDNNITPFSKDIAKWYSDLVLQSELVLYGPVKGTMFFRPYGFSIWNIIKNELTKEFSKLNVDEVNFPLLFPESLLSKEKENFKGFVPEVLTITKVGSKNLNENYIVRPTSEVLFGTYFKETLNSYKDLPVKLNQWVSVMRWENNTRPFLRNSEFLWQEGHTTHANEEEALGFAKEIHKLYTSFAKEFLLLPIFSGKKTNSEKFAGAVDSFTIETILKDGQALQSGTSHYLGQSFTKAFNVEVLGSDNKRYNPFQSSWGVSTRLIGALIMTHSDDKGLRLPSKIAPFQAVILTLGSEKNKEVLIKANEIKEKLNSNRIFIDSSNKGIGFKAREWEVKGVPIRIEIGPRDVENNNVVISLRTSNEKEIISINDINSELIFNKLIEYDSILYKEAKQIKETKKVEANSMNEINEIIESGNYATAYWTEDLILEKEIKEKTGASIRVLIEEEMEGTSISDSKTKTKTKAIFARAY